MVPLLIHMSTKRRRGIGIAGTTGIRRSLMRRNQRIADEEFTTRLQHSLRQTSPDPVRMSCLEELADMEAIPRVDVVKELLLRTLREDPNAVVRHEAAFVLGRLH